MNKNKTKVVTSKNTRLSYFHGWTPVSINGGPEKYSTAVLIPKSDTATLDAIEKAIDAAIEEGLAKFGGKKPNKAAIKLPLRDGDIERDDEAYKGHYFINANSTTHLKLWIKMFNQFSTNHKFIADATLVCQSTFMPLIQMGIKVLQQVLEIFNLFEMENHLRVNQVQVMILKLWQMTTF